MPFDIGINYRGSSSFANDSGVDTYCLSSSYPITRGGATFGWLHGVTFNAAGLDRDLTNGVELAGSNFATNSTLPGDTFQFDLPSAGSYSIRLALGDEGGNQTYQYCQFLDNNTPLFTVSSTLGTAAGHFLDATGVNLAGSNWSTGNTAVTQNFISTTLKLIISVVASSNSGIGGSTTLTHIQVTQLAASGGVATVLQFLLTGVGV